MFYMYSLLYKNMRRTIHKGNQLLMKNQLNQTIQSYVVFIVFMLLMIKKKNISFGVQSYLVLQKIKAD